MAPRRGGDSGPARAGRWHPGTIDVRMEAAPPVEPPPHVDRRLAAIFAADVAGYSRLMGLDEAGTAGRAKRRTRRGNWPPDSARRWRYPGGMKTHRKAKAPQLADADLTLKLSGKKEYERKLAALQLRLLEIQQAYMRQHRRGIIVLEGWDTAGKGGIVRRIGTRLDPRYLNVWPIAAPSADDQGRHYLYRFWTRLPLPGSIALFDRSWYGRVLVERVESLVLEDEWRRAYEEINQFERMLADDGVRLVKLFLHITPAEQLRRFQERLSVPYKRWKLTLEDLRNRARWGDYEVAINDMLRLTHTPWAPWHVVPIEYKWYGRIRALKTIAKTLGRGVNLDSPPADPRIASAIRAMGDPRPQ